MKRTMLTLAAAAWIVPAAAQQLENSKTHATAGTNGTGSYGRASGANLSDGNGGPAAETRMPSRAPTGSGPTDGGGGGGGISSSTTKELYQH